MPICDQNPASEEYGDFIIRHNNSSLEEILLQYPGHCIDYVDQEFAIIYSPLEPLLPITIKEYTYSAIPKLYTLLDTTSMEASGIIQNFEQPTLNLRGEGTMIGFIDTGIDYRNPLFQLPDGRSRILGIWDQTLPTPTGTTDAPFGIPASIPSMSFSYGQEFSKSQIDEALHSPDPLSVVSTIDTSGHGTFMAGIAAGGVTANGDFTGAAPDCSIGVVKMKPAKKYLRDFYLLPEDAIAYQENDIMMGVKYLVQLARQQSLPLVIYIGLGTNYGNHEGTSPLGLVLNNIERLVGVSVVLPAGNETGLRHHYMGRLLSDQEYDDVEIRVASGERGFFLEFWAFEPEIYTVGFLSPTGERIQQLPIELGMEYTVTFPLDQTVITVNYRISEIGSGSQFIIIRFDTPASGIWQVRVYNSLLITGIFHMWLPVQGFIKEDTIFLRADPDTTITEPANAFFPVTVSTYDHTNNSIYIHSSRGYSRVGLIKPDLAAPGVNIYGPGLSPSGTDDSFPMIRKTGSSVAAAHVAGAIANLFTWGIVRGNNPAMSFATIRTYLILGADRDPAYTYPNREWGYGRLDLYHLFLYRQII